MSSSKAVPLPCGIVLKNAFCKPATSEHLGDYDHNPTDELVHLYDEWGRSGVGLLITGNLMVDRIFREGTRNCVLDNASDLASYERFAAAAKKCGSACIVQLSHPGRQCPISVTWEKPLAPSAVSWRLPGVGLQMSRTPRAMTVEEIKSTVTAFSTTAGLAVQAGFDGVQIHAAHGYLVSQFLSPNVNIRTDDYGGSPENRMRFLLELVDAVREAIGPNKILSIKMNCSDFVNGGLTLEESSKILEHLSRTRSVDLIEVSGGTYENPQPLLDTELVFRPYFETVKKACTIPLMLTGGITSKARADEVITKDGAAVVGVCRPLCRDPQIINKWLMAEDPTTAVSHLRSRIPLLRNLLVPGLSYTWHQLQMMRIARGEKPDLTLSYLHCTPALIRTSFFDPRYCRWKLPLAIFLATVWLLLGCPLPLGLKLSLFSIA